MKDASNLTKSHITSRDRAKGITGSKNSIFSVEWVIYLPSYFCFWVRIIKRWVRMVVVVIVIVIILQNKPYYYRYY